MCNKNLILIATIFLLSNGCAAQPFGEFPGHTDVLQALLEESDKASSYGLIREKKSFVAAPPPGSAVEATSYFPNEYYEPDMKALGSELSESFQMEADGMEQYASSGRSEAYQGHESQSNYRYIDSPNPSAVVYCPKGLKKASCIPIYD